jgi:plasmid stability protein
MHYVCSMATLVIRDLPEHLYQQLEERARAERRSPAREATVLLEQALSTNSGDRRREVLRTALAEPVPLPETEPTPEELIRENRSR